MRTAPASTQWRPALGEVLDFLADVWALDHALQRSSKRMARTLGLTGPQRLVLRLVGRFPGLPAGALARLLHVDASTLTGILRRLESKGLLSRRADPRDRRRSLLGLTAEGRRLNVAAEGTIEAAVSRVLAGAGADRIAAARALLAAVAAELEQAGARHD